MLLLAIIASRLLKEEVSSNMIGLVYDVLLKCGYCLLYSMIAADSVILLCAGAQKNSAAAAAVSKRYGSAAAAFADGLPPPDHTRAPAHEDEAARSDEGDRNERSEKKVHFVVSSAGHAMILALHHGSSSRA